MGKTGIEFIIVSYDFARFYFKYMKKEVVDAIVIDEIHRLRNPNTGQSRRIGIVAKKIPYRYGLTGTWGDEVIDLFGQFRAINHQLLGDSYKAFKKEWCYGGGFGGFEVKITDRNKREVMQIVAPEMYQVSKREAFPNLKVTPPVRLIAELTGNQRRIYEKLEQDLVINHTDFTITAARKITQLIRLAQVTGGHCPTDDGEMLTFECGKADVFNDFLKDWPKKKKLVIFARFVYELDLIQEICKKNRRTSCIYTPEHPETEDHFQLRDDPIDFIAQIQRGSEALTLTRSSTPVFFSKDHSNLKFRQAMARCDRPGQTEPVTPVLLLTRDTVDEDIQLSVDEKQTETEFCNRAFERIRNRLTRT